MPELLLELFSEEIPARMQRQAADDLKKLVTDQLVERGLTYEGAKAFATPRRLALTIAGLPVRQPDTREERKGPRVGSPEGAVQGFLKSAGLADLSQAKIESDPKKGEFYVAVIERAGRPTLDLLTEILPQVIRNFPWPKSMRWGQQSAEPGSLRWVRPLRAVVATFGAETEDPEIIPFEIDGIKAGNTTYGHRFMAPGAISVKRFDDYITKLEAARVVLDADRRKEIIRADARNLAFAQGLELVEDEGLLEEVAGLVEWPVVLMGSFEEAFLDVPAEVIRATIRANQKCFVLKKAASPSGEGEKRGQDNGLANRFLLTSNIVPADGGAVIVAGNERVIRARLSDAKFFWDTDRRVWDQDRDLTRLERFRNVTFHEKLGSQFDRIARIGALAQELCAITGAAPDLVARAAKLVKLDLQTEVVGEFPEVQGFMGRVYAGLVGEHASVAAACEEHYKPAGPGDRVPGDPVSVTVALADKLDTLVGFWAIDEKPTGSKDPYALRRAALGVIRLVVENGLRLNAGGCFRSIYITLLEQYASRKQILWADERDEGDVFQPFYDLLERDKENGVFEIGIFPREKILEIVEKKECRFVFSDKIGVEHRQLFSSTQLAVDLLSFFHDRLKVMLRDQGARHDLVDAVLANGEANDDLLLVVRRVEALGAFLESEDGKSLLAGAKRATNILRAEEKKDGEGAFEAPADPAILQEPAEKALHAALATAGEAAMHALQKPDFAAAMRAMAPLRAPVDAFFDSVLVNAEDASQRRNRLALLATLRRVTRQVADFSKIAG